MDTQPISSRCPKCHAPLPADAPQGLCPKCLLAAVATPTEAGQPEGRPAPPPLELIAAAFPQLEILEFIGQGGMGFVFKARQPKLDRLVALKILPQSLAADPTFAERFHREAKLLARLSHPGIVTVHDFGCVGMESASSPFDSEKEKRRKGEEENKLSTAGVSSAPSPLFSSAARPLYYLLMEFVDGVNLRQAMQAGRFTPEQALAIVPKICEALQFAHNEGILHRDIKPENILLDAKGRVKIADFGIAKLVGDVAQASQPAGDLGIPAQVSGAGATNWEQGCSPNPQAGKPALQALTEAGKSLGTPNYMAPEQLANAGDVDHRADIYSLGVVFYEMLTGELPRGQFAPPSQKSAADPRVDEVVLRALEKEKSRRHGSADEVRTQVETITGSAGVPPVSRSSRRESALIERGSAYGPTATPARPSRKTIAAMLCLLVVILIQAGLWWSRREPLNVWLPARLSGAIGDPYGEAQIRVTAVGQEGQVVLLKFSCDTAIPDRALLAQYSGPVFDYPTDIASHVTNQNWTLDCLMAPAFMDGGQQKVLAGSRELHGKPAYGMGFVLPNEETAAKVVEQIRKVHFNKPRGLKAQANVLMVFSLHRTVGSNTEGKPVSENLSAMISWQPRPEAASKAAPEKAALTFGPVVERIISPVSRGSNQPPMVFFSLKSGKEFQPPFPVKYTGLPQSSFEAGPDGFNFIELTPEFRSWARAQSVDLVAAFLRTPFSFWRWQTLDTRVWHDVGSPSRRYNEAETTFDSITPQTAFDVMQRPLPRFLTASSDGDRDHTFVAYAPFATTTNEWPSGLCAFVRRDGTTGVLNISARQEPLQLKIRYKLVEAEPVFIDAQGKRHRAMIPATADTNALPSQAAVAKFITTATNGSTPVVESAIPRDGVYFTYTGYMTTVLEIKGGRFRYWFETDVKDPDEPAYPISGPIRITADTIALIHEKCGQPTWTFRTMDGHRTLWRPDALAIPAADRKWNLPMLKRYGAGSVLIASDKRAEELWERRGPPNMGEITQTNAPSSR